MLLYIIQLIVDAIERREHTLSQYDADCNSTDCSIDEEH